MDVINYELVVIKNYQDVFKEFSIFRKLCACLCACTPLYLFMMDHAIEGRNDYSQINNSTFKSNIHIIDQNVKDFRNQNLNILIISYIRIK